MTSSNGNIFRVTGPLCGEFTGPGEFPTQRLVTWSFDVFFDLRLNKWLSKQSWGWWFETLSWSWWRHCNEVKLPQKIQLYISLVKSVLIHESGAWGLTRAETTKLDASNRKQLRRLLGIKCPIKITNVNLIKCRECPLSETIQTYRWRPFGNTLTRNRNIPTYRAMTDYFQEIPNRSNFRGHTRTTLLVTRNNELDLLYKHSTYK